MGGKTAIEIKKGTGVDVLAVSSGTLNYGGTLALSLTGTPLVNGDSFTLFSAGAYTGSFTTITPTKPGAGLNWDTSQLTVSGALGVVCDSTLVASAGPNKYICAGSSVGIGGSPTATGGSGSGYTYSWSPATGLSARRRPIPRLHPRSRPPIRSRSPMSVGCTASSSMTVYVNAAPAISTQPANHDGVQRLDCDVLRRPRRVRGSSYSWANDNNSGWGSAWTVTGSGGTWLGTSTDNDNFQPACNSFSANLGTSTAP